MAYKHDYDKRAMHTNKDKHLKLYNKIQQIKIKAIYD